MFNEDSVRVRQDRSCRHSQEPSAGRARCLTVVRLQVRKVIWRLFEIWPDAETAAAATDDTLVLVEKLIQPLGLFRKRTVAIKRFSQEYLQIDVSKFLYQSVYTVSYLTTVSLVLKSFVYRECVVLIQVAFVVVWSRLKASACL